MVMKLVVFNKSMRLILAAGRQAKSSKRCEKLSGRNE